MSLVALDFFDAVNDNHEIDPSDPLITNDDDRIETLMNYTTYL